MAHLQSAYQTDATKPSRTRHPSESRQNKLHIHFDTHRRRSVRKYEHSALTNVYAVASVIVSGAVGPTQQKRQRYLKPQSTSPLDRFVHIRTRFPLASSLTIATKHAPNKRANVFRSGAACGMEWSSMPREAPTARLSGRGNFISSRGVVRTYDREGRKEGSIPQACGETISEAILDFVLSLTSCEFSS